MEDLAPLIRDPERVMPLIRKYYQSKPYQANGAYSINANGIAEIAEKFTSFQIILKDYSQRPIAVEFTDNGPLVDWESWVAHCETPWEDFIKERVTEPTLVRVNMTKDSYYNFDFRDDSQWTCYRLERSSDESVIFGYLPADSPLKTEFPKSSSPLPATFVITVRYPEEATTGDQVLITELIQSGWVLGF